MLLFTRFWIRKYRALPGIFFTYAKVYKYINISLSISIYVNIHIYIYFFNKIYDDALNKTKVFVLPSWWEKFVSEFGIFKFSIRGIFCAESVRDISSFLLGEIFCAESVQVVSLSDKKAPRLFCQQKLTCPILPCQLCWQWQSDWEK